MRTKHWNILKGAFIVLLCSSCSLVGSSDSGQNGLESNRQLWENHHLSGYQYILDQTCYCAGWVYPAMIKVRADTVAAVIDPETGDVLRHPATGRPALQEIPEIYHTVEGLFDIVERAQENYARLEVRYDEEYGYPAVIDFDMYEGAADDQVRYEVKAFQSPYPQRINSHLE